MANEVTSTVLTDQILTELILPEVMEAVRETSVVLPLCRIQSLENIGTKTASFQRHAAVTVSSITEGTALSNAAYSDTNVTITVAQKGAKLELMDLAIESTVPESLASIGASVVKDVYDDMENTAAALLGGFSNTVGTTTANITVAQAIAALTTLRINMKGAANKAAFVLYPQQVGDLQTAAVGEGSTTAFGPALGRQEVIDLYGANADVLGASCGSILGKPVFQSVHVPTANTGADSAGAVLCAGEALGAAIKWMPKLEMQRAIVNGQPGWAMMAYTAFGVGEILDAAGVSIITDR